MRRFSGFVCRDQLRGEILNEQKPFAFGGNQPLELNGNQSKAINNLKIPGVFAVKQKFNSANMLASQLLGTTVKYSSLPKERYPNRELTTDTRVGDKGLQRTFDEFLLSSGESKSLCFTLMRLVGRCLGSM